MIFYINIAYKEWLKEKKCHSSKKNSNQKRFYSTKKKEGVFKLTPKKTKITREELLDLNFTGFTLPYRGGDAFNIDINKAYSYCKKNLDLYNSSKRYDFVFNITTYKSLNKDLFISYPVNYDLKKESLMKDFLKKACFWNDTLNAKDNISLFMNSHPILFLVFDSSKNRQNNINSCYYKPNGDIISNHFKINDFIRINNENMSFYSSRFKSLLGNYKLLNGSILFLSDTLTPIIDEYFFIFYVDIRLYNELISTQKSKTSIL